LKEEFHRNGKSVTHEMLGNQSHLPSALAAPIMAGIPQGLKPRGILDKIGCW
jgi:hypothetical protein